MLLPATTGFRGGNASEGLRPQRRAARAFTLIEMLVVLIIIGMLAALALPHIRGNLESRAIDAASRQLLEDFSLARQKAIAQRSTVAVVFVPPNIQGQMLRPPLFGPEEITNFARLQGGVYTHYALYAFRQVGEQPGSHSPRYITEWKSLPEKTFIDPTMFAPGALLDSTENARRSQKFAFPSTRPNLSGSFDLPYIAFNAEGQCVKVTDQVTGASEFDGEIDDIPIARGSILFSREPDGKVLPVNYDVQQIPAYNSTQNVIHVDALTGRAKWIKAELK